MCRLRAGITNRKMHSTAAMSLNEKKSKRERERERAKEYTIVGGDLLRFVHSSRRQNARAVPCMHCSNR